MHVLILPRQMKIILSRERFCLYIDESCNRSNLALKVFSVLNKTTFLKIPNSCFQSKVSFFFLNRYQNILSNFRSLQTSAKCNFVLLKSYILELAFICAKPLEATNLFNTENPLFFNFQHVCPHSFLI